MEKESVLYLDCKSFWSVLEEVTEFLEYCEVSYGVITPKSSSFGVLRVFRLLHATHEQLNEA